MLPFSINSAYNNPNTIEEEVVVVVNKSEGFLEGP
jgi:hypothetical protein